MKRLLPILLLAFTLSANFCAMAQVQTEIKSENIYELSIVQVLPDSFPQVQVVFLARDSAGRPLWNISAEELFVLEDDEACEILELKNISKSEVIDIALVLDHSGSMGYPTLPDSLYIYPWSNDQIDSLMELPKPIDFAKDGVLSFISSGELKSDSILIVGFSSWTDSIVGPTQDVAILETKIKSVEAGGGTAFYDALSETLNHLSSKKDGKSAIVALTDGLDNQSKSTVSEVVEMSKQLDIPIYVIGLGNVQDSILSIIADSTNGLYYKTDDPSQLQEIYLNISRQLKSIYKLKYSSNINGFASNEHSLKFGFKNDTLLFSNPDIRLSLPDEVVSYIHEQEQARIDTNRNLIFGGVGIGLIAIGLSTFLLYRRKNSKKLKIAGVYPNPFQTELNVTLKGKLNSEEYEIQIVDSSGNQVFTIKSQNKENKLDLSHLPRGTYIVHLTGPDGISNQVKAMKN